MPETPAADALATPAILQYMLAAQAAQAQLMPQLAIPGAIPGIPGAIPGVPGAIPGLLESQLSQYQLAASAASAASLGGLGGLGGLAASQLTAAQLTAPQLTAPAMFMPTADPLQQMLEPQRSGQPCSMTSHGGRLVSESDFGRT